MRTLTVIIILIISGAANIAAQTTLRIISSTDHAPLPYATVLNSTQRTMLSSDDSGFVNLNTHAGDTIHVTYIGCLPGMMICNDQPTGTLILQRDLKTMKAVTVSSCKFYESITARDFEGREKYFIKGPGTTGISALPVSGLYLDARVAMLISSPQADAFISTFSFWLRKYPFTPDSAIGSPMLISFYSIGEGDSFPGELLTNKQIICRPKKAGRQTINIDSLHIKIPAEGIYACFQWAIDERYQWEMRYTSDTSNTEIVRRYQGLNIDGIFAAGHRLVFYDWLNKVWFTAASRYPRKPEDKPSQPIPSTIRYEVLLKYCK